MTQGLKPRYCQIRDDLMAAIREQRILPNEQIPTEVEIMEQYGVSRTTVRRAIQDLVDSGTLTRRQGNGTFVNEPRFTRNIISFTSFTQDCIDHGEMPDTEVSEIEYVEPKAEIRRELCMEDGEKAFRFSRLRFINGVPVGIEIDLVPERYDRVGYCARSELKSLTSFFENVYGVGVEQTKATLQTAYATREEAAMLNIHVGATLIVIESIAYAGSDIPMYHAKQIFAGELSKISISGERQRRHSDSGE